jgi:hypothetical protein
MNEISICALCAHTDRADNMIPIKRARQAVSIMHDHAGVSLSKCVAGRHFPTGAGACLLIPLSQTLTISLIWFIAQSHQIHTANRPRFIGRACGNPKLDYTHRLLFMIVTVTMMALTDHQFQVHYVIIIIDCLCTSELIHYISATDN